jgi:low temperature requirement protein LtrA
MTMVETTYIDLYMNYFDNFDNKLLNKHKKKFINRKKIMDMFFYFYVPLQLHVIVRLLNVNEILFVEVNSAQLSGSYFTQPLVLNC